MISKQCRLLISIKTAVLTVYLSFLWNFWFLIACLFFSFATIIIDVPDQGVVLLSFSLVPWRRFTPKMTRINNLQNNKLLCFRGSRWKVCRLRLCKFGLWTTQNKLSNWYILSRNRVASLSVSTRWVPVTIVESLWDVGHRILMLSIYLLLNFQNLRWTIPKLSS